MSGKPKAGLSYAGWSVDIFDGDTKIDKLLDAQGWVGFGVYFYLCQMAYKHDGYFYRWTYDDAATTARRMGGGVGSETVKNAVGLCLQIGLFDKPLFDRDGILTSRGIQRRYRDVIQGRRVKSVIADYWLLNDEESEGLEKCTANENPPPANGHLQATNGHLQPTNAPKSKGKKSKYILCPDTASAARDAGAETNDGRARKRRIYRHDETPYKAAAYLSKRISENVPRIKPADENRLQRWADEFRKLHEIDGYEWPLIDSVLVWCQDNTFWQTNIMSGEKFREKFETLLAKMEAQK